jgi:hypothetical protein
MSSLVSTMLTRRQEELNVVEGSAYNCSCHAWKPAFHVMVAKVLQIASWVPVHSSPWAQHKRWIFIRLMGCVHTHWEMPAIERWGNPNHVQNVVQKNREDNWKAGKISQIINQVPTLGSEHDKIWTQWASNVLLKNMLKQIWWCRCSKMESWSSPIYCLMNCSNGGRHARARGGKRSHAVVCNMFFYLILKSWI